MVSFTLKGAIAKAVVLASLVIPLVSGDGLPALRILPLGDSITKGNLESLNNGYRERLRQQLVSYSSNGIDMIGSMQTGRMLSLITERVLPLWPS